MERKTPNLHHGFRFHSRNLLLVFWQDLSGWRKQNGCHYYTRTQRVDSNEINPVGASCQCRIENSAEQQKMVHTSSLRHSTDGLQRRNK